MYGAGAMRRQGMVMVFGAIARMLMKPIVWVSVMIPRHDLISNDFRHNRCRLHFGYTGIGLYLRFNGSQNIGFAVAIHNNMIVFSQATAR